MKDAGDHSSRLTYSGGFDAVLRQMEGRRDPMTFGEGEGLPPANADLSPMRSERVGEVSAALRKSRSGFGAKSRELHREFHGQPALCYFHGLLIAVLRRREVPPEAPELFVNLWAEHSDFLLANLDARWLVSAITTFGDHGTTGVQRRTGHALSVLFNTMKLYETERLFSEATPDRPFSKARKSNNPLPLQMDAYAVTGGGLDINMLGRLWLDAGEDRVIAPLAHHLLDALNSDDRNVFRRLRLMREARENGTPIDADVAGDALFNPRTRTKSHPAPIDPARIEHDPDALTWGVVSTVNAPLVDIARFAAWHLKLGAAQITLYLDDADPDKAAFLSRNPKVKVILCDDAHWQSLGRRPKAHQVRQTANATHAYHQSQLHWLAHVDHDEFIMPDRRLADVLAQVPDDLAVINVPPVEYLAPTDPDAPAFFKTTARMGGQNKGVLNDLYPTYGPHLRGGYVSHLEGKCIVRTGIKDVQFGIHSLNLAEKGVSNRAVVNGTYLGHAHAPSYDHFIAKLQYRLDHGSYRKKDNVDFRLADIIDFLMETEGEDGIKHFYDEVCTAHPRLVNALADKNMLVSIDLDLDAATRKVFGDLPVDEAG
ncbi:MAG: glycosyltransferase family 2 protein [Pseudooceanicola sp.]